MRGLVGSDVPSLRLPLKVLAFTAFHGCHAVEFFRRKSPSKPDSKRLNDAKIDHRASGEVHV